MSDLRIVAGYLPDERGADGLALAAMVARTAKSPLTVVNVHPPAWPSPGPGAVDAEWVGYLKEQAKGALAEAADRLAGTQLAKSRVRYRVHAHRGSGRGLVEVADDVGAGLIVIGSGPRGRSGRIAIGSTADQLLHGSPVPVLLAPRGYADDGPERPDRLTVAYWRRRDAELGLRAAAEFAELLNVPIRLLTLVLRPAGLPVRLRSGEDAMFRQYELAERELAVAAELIGDLGVVETDVVEGADVSKALGAAKWAPGEILACMSSREGPFRKVFLGGTSGKIVRAAHCPVLMLPHTTLR